MALTWSWLRRPSRQRIEEQFCVRYMRELTSNLFVSLPDATKRLFISHAQSVLGYPTFVETGTYMGQMSWHASRLFRTVHTIELSPTLAKRAVEMFAGRSNVTVHPGDSARVLPELLRTIDTPCIFWLDGHYSGDVSARGDSDTPILAELEAIAAHRVRPHGILIDDCRVFGTDDAYPTLGEVIACLRRIDPGFKIGVACDIIWAAPVKILDFRWRVSPAGMVIPPTTAPDT
jgi:hypothetical protein